MYFNEYCLAGKSWAGPNSRRGQSRAGLTDPERTILCGSLLMAADFEVAALALPAFGEAIVAAAGAFLVVVLDALVLACSE